MPHKILITFATLLFLKVTSQNTSFENKGIEYENNLKLTMKCGLVKQHGLSDSIFISIANQSEFKRFKIVLPGDGSELAWREPYVYFTSHIKRENGEWGQLKAVSKIRCGYFDADWQKDTLTISPNQKFEIYRIATKDIINQFTISSVSSMKFTVHYDYNHERDHYKNGMPNEYKDEVLDELKIIPSFTLISEIIEIEVK